METDNDRLNAMVSADNYLKAARNLCALGIADHLDSIRGCEQCHKIEKHLRARDERVRREVWIEAQELSAQCGSRDHTEEAFRRAEACTCHRIPSNGWHLDHCPAKRP